MNKILLLGLNCRFTHSNLALYYLRESLQNIDWQVDLAELTINNSKREILEKIWRIKPDVLAISVYIWNGEIVERILPDLKQLLPNMKIVLGGPEVSYNHTKWYQNFAEIDHIICGNGESVLPELLAGKLTDRLIRAIPIKFSEVPFPYRDSDFPALKSKYIYYESSRGCPFRCSYCLSSRSDQKLDFRPLEMVLDELNWLLQKEPKIIKFIDRTFNAKASHHRTIWKNLIAHAGSTKFHCEIHPEFLEDEDFEILQSAPDHLFQFEIGIQSTNPQTISTINRKEDWQKSRANILRLIALNKFHIHTDLIVGLPFEDIKSLQKSFDDIISLDADHFQMGFLKILPGTEMAEKIAEYEMSHTSTEPYEVLQNRWLNFDEIIHLKQIEDLLDKFFNSERFIQTIKYCHQLYGSPYLFYSELAKWQSLKDFDLSIKNWAKNCEQLIEFISDSFPDQKQLLIDILRYDWCNVSKNDYPDIIDSVANKQLQKDAQNYFRNFNQSGIIKYKGLELSIKSIKHANYFRAETVEFYKLVKIEPEVWMYLEQKVFLGIILS